MKQTAETWAINQTSPSVAHQSKSVPAKRNAQIQALVAPLQPKTLAELPRRSDRDAGEDDGEQRLIRLRAENRHVRQEQERRQRGFDNVVAAVGIMQRIDIRARPVDPDASVQERLREQNEVVIGCWAQMRDQRGHGERDEAGDDGGFDPLVHIRGIVACGSGLGGWKVEGGRLSGKR